MANGNMNQQPQVGANPPALDVQKSNNPLESPQVVEKGRRVVGKDVQQLVSSGAANNIDVLTVQSPRTGSKTDFTPAQLAQQFQNSPDEFQRLLKNVVSGQVKTPKLLNSRGEIVRDQYNPDDAVNELRKMRPADRIAFLNELYKRDFYPGKSGPSATGLDSSSVNAMEQFLLTVNDTGYVMDVAKPIIFSTYEPVQGLPGTGGTPRQYAITSAEDIKSVADQVAQQIIGRRLTAGQAAKIVKQVQSAERKAGLQQGTEQLQAPSPQVLAQAQIERQFAGETQLMRMGDATRIHENLMRSM
jgi:hypothetical protein